MGVAEKLDLLRNAKRRTALAVVFQLLGDYLSLTRGFSLIR